jgi:hypothetical protein
VSDHPGFADGIQPAVEIDPNTGHVLTSDAEMRPPYYYYDDTPATAKPRRP